MSDRESFSLESVLHAPSIKEISKLSPYAIRLAKRWAKEMPAKIRELEASGKLLAALKQGAEDESLRQWRSRVRVVRGDAAPRADSGPSARG
jgi:hypothetical protein